MFVLNQFVLQGLLYDASRRILALVHLFGTLIC
jgi:hypothetical protein